MNTIKWLIAVIAFIVIIAFCVWYQTRMSKKYISFSCNQCGTCCRLLKKTIEQKDKLPCEVQQLINEFPYTFDAFGACEKLVDNKCSVYDTRPDICNIKKSWERAFKNKMTLQEYYNLNYLMCQ